MIYGLNDNLPFDVNVISSIKTVDKFHARYSALKEVMFIRFLEQDLLSVKVIYGGLKIHLI